VKLDISLEAFLMADRYVTKDGKEWVNMVVQMEKLLDVLEGKAEAAGISQLETCGAIGDEKGAEVRANHA
jgi:hypothetical protein